VLAVSACAVEAGCPQTAHRLVQLLIPAKLRPGLWIQIYFIPDTDLNLNPDPSKNTFKNDIFLLKFLATKLFFVSTVTGVSYFQFKNLENYK
jgi:hypothetical protein